MEIPQEVLGIGGGAVLVVVALVVAYVVLVRRRADFTPPVPPGEKPEWMRTTPPAETNDALREDGEPAALYDHDPGEQVAAPFTEQIEDVLRARLGADPALARFDVDLGTGPGGEIEFWVDGRCYEGIGSIPDERLRGAIREAIGDWRGREA
jgi:hypothetical protein